MAALVCPKCRREVPLALANTGRPYPCGGCGQQVILDVFPAAWRTMGRGNTGPAGEGVASCFFHDERPAETACDGCGRFLCALCDVPVGRLHLCPECLESRNRWGARQGLVNERIPWDRVALALALWPVVLVVTWVFTLVTAPGALFLVVWGWRQPGSLVGRSWLRFTIAGLLASAQIALWILFIGGLWTGALQ
jgi:hypothetical protein